MIKELFQFFAALAAFFVVMFFVAFFTVGVFDGGAKSAYLKRTKGIDIPWYQATFLTIKITDNDVNIGDKK